jgi:hypothetical protein
MFRFGDPGGRMYTTVGTGQANLLAYWTSVVNGASFSVSAGNGRLGGSSLRISAVGNLTEYRVRKTLDAQSTWGMAFAFRASAIPFGSTQIASVMDVTAAQLDLKLNPDFTLSITRGGTVLGTSSAALAVNAYSHLEWKVLIHPSVGTIELRKNGVLILGPLTGLNTRNTANSTANVVTIGADGSGNGNNANWDYDDIIVYDGQTVDPNGLTDIIGPIGDCTLRWLLPTGVGNTTQFLPDAGANYTRVNEATPDGDASYVSSANLNDIDTYALADLPVGTTIVRSIAVCCYARKTDANVRAIAAMIRTGGTNYGNAVLATLGTSYLYNFFGWGQNPSTGTPWTPADINALEAGQKVTT